MLSTESSARQLFTSCYLWFLSLAAAVVRQGDGAAARRVSLDAGVVAAGGVLALGGEGGDVGGGDFGGGGEGPAISMSSTIGGLALSRCIPGRTSA